jgi:hypothetical protein
VSCTLSSIVLLSKDTLDHSSSNLAHACWQP